VTRAHKACELGAKTRAELKGRFPSDRDARLGAAIEELSVAMKPLRAHLLHSPTFGKDRQDPIRLASKRVSAERRRLRRMQGDPEERVPPRRTLRTIPSIRGTLGYVKGKLGAIEEDLKYLQKAHRYRYDFRSRLGLRAEGQQMKAELERLAALLTEAATDLRAHSGQWRQDVGDQDVAEDALVEVAALRQRRSRLSRVARRLADTKTLSQARNPQVTRRWRRWDRETVKRALSDFYDENGRLPKAAEFADVWWLPSYGTFYKCSGGLRCVKVGRRTGRRSWSPAEILESLAAWRDRTGALPTAKDLRTHPELPSYGTIHARFGGLRSAKDALTRDESVA
jgi:hypothetical protein